MFRTIFLVVLLKTQCNVIESSAILTRHRREDNPIDTMKTVAVLGIGMAKDAATDAFEQGISAQKSANVNVFGYTAGYDTGFKVGGGGSAKSNDEDSSEEKRRRRRRSFVYHIMDDSGVMKQRHKRQVYSDDFRDTTGTPNRNNSQLDAEEVANNFLQKMKQVWMDVLQRVRSWFEETTNRVQNQNESSTY